MSTDLIAHDLTRDKIELIKQTVAKGSTDLEFELFLHACKRTGLDPLMKQIYAIKRWSAVDRREVLSFQTGIDGYRLIADRTGKYAGSTDPQYELNDEGFPGVASVTVYKVLDNGVRGEFSASARWLEYCQRTKEGEPTSMWKKMPFLMLGKCAEALALRKAFPAELSGVYTHEEMMQADQEQRALSPVAQHQRDAKTKLGELMREGAAAATNMGAAASESGAGGADTPPPASDAPSDELKLTNAIDHRAALDAASTIEALQRSWDEIVKDTSLTSPERKTLYGQYMRRVKQMGTT